MSSSSLLRSSMASASSLMALQLLSRVFTFALNQALFRLASPSAFGAAAIQFELILSTILFLSREGVRNALLRVSRNPSTSTTNRANLSFLPIVSGIPLALGTAVLYTRLASEEIKLQPHFSAAIALYAVAAVTELLSEPLYNVAMVELKTGVRVRAEGLGITAKSLTTFLVLFYDAKESNGTGDLALLAFAFGQLVYGVVMFATYVVYLGGDYMHPKRPSSSENTWRSYIDQEDLNLSFTMTLQSLVKHFLTEGDKMILSWFSPLHDQGGYAIAVNYGSLVARIIFQPIEESLRVFFSRTLSSSSNPSTSSKSTKHPSSSSKSKPPPSSETLLQSASTLRSLLLIQTSMSLILVVFGSAYLSILLPLLLPRQYLSTSAPHVLAAWVWYIPVLAVNGGLEAFLSSVATPKDLNNQSWWMIGFSMIYILSAVLLYRAGFGDASLVYANIVNLSVRILYALRYTTRFFNQYQNHNRQQPSTPIPIFHPKDALPPTTLVLVCALSAVVIRTSARTLDADQIAVRLGRTAIFHPAVLLHVAVGVVLGVACVGTWWATSGRYMRMRTQLGGALGRRDKVD